MPTPNTHEVVNIRTDVIIHYNHILDLSKHSRSVMAPYVRGGGVKIEQMGRPEEKVTILYEEERSIVAMEWNRVGMATQGPRGDYQDENGPLRNLLDIFDKIKELDGFSATRAISLSTYDVVKTTESKTARGFKEKYISSIAIRPEGDIEDVAVSINTKHGSVEYKTIFGNFNPATDITDHDLLVASSWKIDDLVDVEGVLMHTQMIDRESSPSHGKLIDMLRKIDMLAQQIS